MQSLFDKTGSYHDVKGTGVLALFGDATIDIGNNRHLVINKDKITITDDTGDIIIVTILVLSKLPTVSYKT